MHVSQHWSSAAILFLGWIGQGSARTCFPAYNAEAKYVGCFQDQDTLHDLTGPQLEIFTANSPRYCANICGAAGFSFSGLKNGIHCYCGHQIEKYAVKANEASCNATCPGDASKKCGDTTMINIYQIDNPGEKGQHKPGGPDCSREPLCSNKICDGSLSMTDRARGLVDAMTLDEKISNIGDRAAGVSRLGLPHYGWWSEALHGVARSPSVQFQTPLGTPFSAGTSFPMPILMSAAFDDALIRGVASTISIESRAFGNAGYAGLNFWTPNINPFRDPRWGRGMETPGEDPHHIAKYTYNLVTAFEGDDRSDYKRAMATCKHYAAYDVEDGREGNDLRPTAQDMADYYLPMFQTCVRDAKVSSIMCAYNSVYGVPSCASNYLLQDILRDHWNFTEPYNYVVSDCDAIRNIYDPHHYASSPAAAAADALNAGTDLDCGPSYSFSMGEAIQSKLTSQAVLDKSLVRLYSALIKVGYFDAVPEYNSLSWADVNTKQAQKLAYQAAVEGMTLLKNDGTLPLVDEKLKKVAVIGPWGNATKQMLGVYEGTAPFLVSPLSAFQQRWPDVQFAPGTDIDSQNTTGFAAALSVAKAADCIIFMGGIDATIERESQDRQAITWPGNQLDLVSQLSKLGKPLVIVQFGGGQIDDASLLANGNINSILWAGYPGQDGGNAVLDVLTGVAPPAGRLPVTQYPANYVEGNNINNMNLRPSSSFPGRTYMWYTGKPTLPFGHGLHYTNFSISWDRVPSTKSYDIATLLSSATAENKDLSHFETFSIDVKNTGGPAEMTSDYVGLLFLSSTNAGPAPYPKKQLVSYGRLHHIKTGTSQRLDLTVELGSLARADSHGDKYIFPGDYTVAVDNDATLTFAFELTGEAALIDSLPRNKGSNHS
ncbi:hypothetical protein E4U21_004998 [Claviceps maximensis]|nr:hypothetical protein E4U21_004998 [Claviceps maximensis]